MATSSLVVELDARTQRLETALNRTQADFERLSGAANRTNSSFGSFSKVGEAVGKGLSTTAQLAKKAAVAFLAVKGAMTAAAMSSAKYSKEIKINADLMKLSVEETQAWASATASVGIDLDKLGDISKDTSEKIGDFLNTGGGGFQDFADALKLTEEQANATAKEFQGMAAPDVLQAMVSRLEDAGVNAEQMSHALEGMGSDTTRLIPLLTEGGKAVKALRNNFYETAVVLNETDIEKLGELSASFTRLGETFDGTMGKFSVEYADQINSIIQSTQEGLKIVGDEFASGSFTDRMNSFYDAFTDSWAVAMGDNIGVFDDFTGDATEVIKTLSVAWLDFVLTLPLNLAIAGNHIKEIFNDIIDEIVIKMGEANLLIQEGLEAIGLDGDVEGAQATLDMIQAETDARDEASDSEIERLRAEKEAILDKYRAEQEAATVKREQYATDAAERMKIIDNEGAAERKKVKGITQGDDDESKSSAAQAKAKEKGKADFTKNAMVLNQVLFDDNKAIAAGLIVAETAQNVVTSVKNSGGVPWGLPAGAAAAAMGIAQLAALKSSSKGGGSISGAGGYSAPAQQNFQQETSSLSLTDASANGSQSINITVPDGDEIGQAIANWLSKANSEGRT